MGEKLSFDYIALSEYEEKLLDKIKQQDIPEVVSSDSLTRLFRHKLVENHMLVKTDGTDSQVYLKAVVITDYGKDYLAYVAKQKRERRKNFLQSVLITVLSAIFGALLSQPVWSFLNKLFT